jgi:hypothetical protein
MNYMTFLQNQTNNLECQKFYHPYKLATQKTDMAQNQMCLTSFGPKFLYQILLISPTPRRTGSILFLPELTLFAALFPEVP